MKKQILSVTMSIAFLSITPLLADSSSDDNDFNSSRKSTKKKSTSSNVKKQNSKEKRSSHHNSKQASEDSKDNPLQHNKTKTTGKSSRSIFTTQSFKAELSGEGSPAYSIPTTDSPADNTTTTSGEEILTPKPQVVKKNKSARQPKHAAAFEKSSGHKSATTYVKENNGNINAPQIGHAQGYQNHGSLADTRKNNLAVISQTTNLKMNIADRKYQNGDVDANCFIAQKDTKLATYAIQQQANPSDHSLALTPSIVLEANMQNLSIEENTEFKKKVERAFDPERSEMIAKQQAKKPENFLTVDESRKKVQKKTKECEAEGRKGPHVFKFSDQSRENRNEVGKDKKDKKDKR